MSINLVQGGASQTITHDSTSLPTSLSAGQYAIFPPGYGGSTAPVASGTIPAVGTPVVNGHFTITNTGTVETFSGQTYAILALSVDSSSLNGAGYALGAGPNTGAGYRAGAFNVGDFTPPAVNASAVSISGSAVTIPYTETENPPIKIGDKIVASGSSVSFYNGSALSPGYGDSNGNKFYYLNGSNPQYVYWFPGTSQWYIASVLGSASPGYKSSGSQTFASGPAGTWTTGTAPAPAIAVVAPTLASQISMSLSGGAVTCTAASLSGSTITATLSRAIASSETGTLSIAAGALSDSPSPAVNYASAGSVPITSANFTGSPTTYGTVTAAEPPTFNESAARSARTYGTRLSAEPATLSEAAGRQARALSGRFAAAALLTQTALAGPVHARFTTYSPRVAVNSLLGSETASRGMKHLAARKAVQSLFAEMAPTSAHGLTPVSLTEAFFSEAATTKARTFSLRSLFEGVLFSSAGRAGRVAPAGSTAPPITSFEAALFTQSASRGPVSQTVRKAVNGLFAEGSVSSHGFSYSPRTAAQPPLFTQSAQGPVSISGPLSPGAVDSRDPFVVLAKELLFLWTTQDNSMSTASVSLAILDKLAASYRINELIQLENKLLDLPTLIRGGDGVTSTIYGYGADDPILILLPAADSMIAQATPSIVLTGIYRGFMAAFQRLASDLGFASLDAYLTSLNTASPRSALVHPNAALISYLYNNQNGNLLLTPSNVFAPQTLFGMAVVGAGAGVVTFTDLNAIPVVSAVNATPGLSQQGYTPAPGMTANITTAINGTLTLTLIGNGQNAAGATVTGRTWTATVSGLAAGASAMFTPAVAGDRISDVTSISGAGAATAGAFSVNSVLERVVS